MLPEASVETSQFVEIVADASSGEVAHPDFKKEYLLVKHKDSVMVIDSSTGQSLSTIPAQSEEAITIFQAFSQGEALGHGLGQGLQSISDHHIEAVAMAPEDVTLSEQSLNLSSDGQ